MRATVLSMGAILLTACLMTAAAHADMQDDINQAVSVLERFQEIPESAVPDVILREAKGLAILTLTKGGFVFSGRGGSGIVVARTEKGWSGPSAIGAGGMGFGFQAGAQVSELVIVLNTPDAVVAFAKGGNVTLGGSQGFFAGVSLEGTVVYTRDEANAEFYGKPVQAREILSGSIPPPAGAQKLLKFLSKY